MGAGHAFMRLQQKMPAPNFFWVGRCHIVGHVAVKCQDLKSGLGMVQMPLNALVVLTVVGPIEMNEGRAFLSIGQNEMRHRGVFDGLRHRKGLPAVAAGHGEHGIVSGKGGVISNGQWGQELLGVVTEVPQGIKAILIDPFSYGLRYDQDVLLIKFSTRELRYKPMINCKCLVFDVCCIV